MFEIFVLFACVSYLGSASAKILFLIANSKEKKNFSLGFILLPFSPILLNSPIQKKILKKNVSKYTILVIELLGIVSMALFSSVILNLLNNNVFSNDELLLLVSLNIFFLTCFLYLSIHDILTLSIPIDFTKIFLFTVVLINLAIGIYRFVIYRTSGADVLVDLQIGYIGNLLAGVVLAGIVWLIIKVSKGIGEGDVDLMFALGMILGWPLALLSIFNISIIGSIISLIYCIKIGRLKKVKVPLVPFILLGYLVTLGFGQNIISTLFNL